MKFCQRHWDVMREAVETRGLTPLVASSGKSAADNLADELARGPSTDNFDPLMAMHWNIASNLLEKLGPNGLYLLSAGDEDPIDVAQLASPLKAKYAGKTWPRCPLCYANTAHEISCRETRCMLSRVDGWDICIEWAADAVKEQFDELMRGGSR